MPQDNATILNDAALNRIILRSIVDHAIVTIDEHGMVTSWNEGAENILGWTEEEILGQSADLFFTPEDVAQNRPEAEMRQALEDGRADDVRWHMRKDGRRFWGSGLMMPLLAAGDVSSDGADGAEPIGGFVKIFRDRTEEYLANARIRKLENRAALAMRRSGTVGVFDIDLADDVTVADGICAQLHGVALQDAQDGVTTEVFLDGVHPDDVARLRRALNLAVCDGRDVDEVYRTSGSDVRPIWVHAQASVQVDTDNRPLRLSGIVVDITEQHERSRMQEARLRFYDTVREMRDIDEIAHLAARTLGETLHATGAGHGVIGHDGDTIDINAAWNAKAGTGIEGRLKYSDYGNLGPALHDGETVAITDTETDPRVQDLRALAGIGIRSLVNMPLMQGDRLSAVLFVTDWRPRQWSDVEIRFMSSILDRTHAAISRIEAERHKAVMAAELAHRMKNMLTIAQVVVSQSLRETGDIAKARAAITARLNALSEAQDVLTKVDHRDASLRDVIDAALRPFATDRNRVRVVGPDVDLTPQQVLGLSLGLHELATNAAKHGALSRESGQIRISWRRDAGSFQFEWRETGGPAVVAPTRKGFGSTILERVVGGYFQGRSEVDFDAGGIVFRLDGHL